MKKYKILFYDNYTKTPSIIVYTDENNIDKRCFNSLKFIKYDNKKDINIYKFVFYNVKNDYSYGEYIIVLHSEEQSVCIVDDYHKDPLTGYGNCIHPNRFYYPAYICTKEIDHNTTTIFKGVWYSYNDFNKGFTDECFEADETVKSAKKYFNNIKLKNILKNEKI